MAVLQAEPRYRFRPGALDAIMRQRNLVNERQLAAFIGCKVKDIERLRAGAMVTARAALRIAAAQGDENYIAAWFDPVDTHVA